MKRWLEKLYWDGILITLIMAVVAILLMLRLHLSDTQASLNAVLHAASLWTLESNADLQELADSIATVSPPIRVTFLMDTGLVLADSDPDSNRNEDHYADPEFVTARQGGVGRDLRVSKNSASFVLYMAKRVSPQLILRVSYPVVQLIGVVLAYGLGLIALFWVLYRLLSMGVSRFARQQVRQIEDVRRLLDGEIEEVEAVFPEFQPSLNAITYRVQRLREDYEEIVKTMTLRYDFVANASHELRSPLTSIMGFAEMLDEGMADTPEEQALCARTIRGECGRMLDVIEDILRLSRAEKAPVAAQPIAVRPIADEVINSLSPQAEQKSISLSVEGEMTVVATEKDLWEILYNLGDNGVRYGRLGGRVRVRLQPGQLVVEDDGIGIAPEHLNRIFEQFYRVDETRDSAKGTGLGLSIVRAIVHRCGGEIRAESETGKGSRFIVTFPREESK